jgi:methyl-accepting chemotaxis protein
MEKVTQNTAAGAEECASAAQELNAQAIAQDSIVGRLRSLAGTTGQVDHSAGLKDENRPSPADNVAMSRPSKALVFK